MTTGNKIATEPRVADIIDKFQFVLNKGSKDGVNINERYFIYSKGPMIIDPDTGNELEAVEVPKGIVVVKHVQETICVVESDEYTEKEIQKETPSTRHRITWYALGSPLSSVEKTKERKSINVSVGDYARMVW
ncbi:hypothetical protein [Aeromonas sp. L_1B5_3]|uniref:hypothetical protein n=1 Tax=Aeromonas sp. L_1B5_3 TaxID=1588629 RepID=UPI0012E05F80|nr:hypothetical protein [Aeromonas sp. L_1B5_3]